MKEKLINIIKWLFIILGIVYLIQLLIAFSTFLAIKNAFNYKNFNNTTSFSKEIKKPKEFAQIIDYANSYFEENNKFPETIENIESIKLKKDLDYKYETNKDSTCYTITIKSQKNNIVKQYQACKNKDKNSNFNTQSYIEYTK